MKENELKELGLEVLSEDLARETVGGSQAAFWLGVKIGQLWGELFG